jgi:hypothetical protein
MKQKNIISGVMLVFLSLGLTMNASSQILISILLGDKLNSDKLEFGLMGGLNRTFLPGLDYSKGSTNLNLGFYFDLKISNQLYAHGSVLVVSKMGAKGLPVYLTGNQHLDTLFLNGSITRQLDYFNVPLELKYLFRNRFYIDGGVMLSLKHGARDVFLQEINEKNDLLFKKDISHQVKAIDAGLIGGIGYKISKQEPGLSIGARYYYGLVNIFKDQNESVNTSLFFYVQIPIGT